MKKLLFSILVIILSASYMQAQTEVHPIGAGTFESPYRISSLGNLYWIAASSARWNFCYKQVNDIDASPTASWFNGQGWLPIGNSTTRFTSSYDGNGFTINNLFISRGENTGLFASVENGSIANLKISSGVNLTGGSSALLVGSCINSVIENCQVNGTVSEGRGLLVGLASLSEISYCSVTGSISSNYGEVGAMIGSASNSTITHCNAEASVTSVCTETACPSAIGGLVGSLWNSSLDQSYANCQINSGITTRVGGLVGYLSGSISNCYSTGSLTGTGSFLGALVGLQRDYDAAQITNSYYNLDSYLINGEHQITIGALPETLFNQWYDADKYLDIDQFFTLSNGRYLIQTAADFIPLMAFAQYPNYSYRLTANLDLSGMTNYFIPLLAGDFDGGGHSISNLHISSQSRNGVGLFGCIYGAEVRDLQIIGFYITGGMQTGALAGMAMSTSIIRNCAASADITIADLQAQNQNMAVGGLVGTITRAEIDSCSSVGYISVTGNTSYIGGLVGLAELSTINNSSSDGVIWYNYGSTVNIFSCTGGLAGKIYESSITDCQSLTTVSGYNWVGGLVGKCDGEIIRCYSSGEIHGLERVGGLVGYNDGDGEIVASSSTSMVTGTSRVGGLVGDTLGGVIDSYARGQVQGNDNVGGLVGKVSSGYYEGGYVYHCYSTSVVSGSGPTIGGLVGSSGGYNTQQGYWNIESSGQSSSAQGSGRTTAQMTFPYAADTYEDWDFNDLWAIDYMYQVNDGYPYIRNTIPGSPVDDPTVPEPVSGIKIYPNPFSSTANIEFTLAKDAGCKLDIFNIRGQKLRSISLLDMKPGLHKTQWDGKDDSGRKVATGIYYIRLKSGAKSKISRVVLLK